MITVALSLILIGLTLIAAIVSITVMIAAKQGSYYWIVATIYFWFMTIVAGLSVAAPFCYAALDMVVKPVNINPLIFGVLALIAGVVFVEFEKGCLKPLSLLICMGLSLPVYIFCGDLIARAILTRFS